MTGFISSQARFFLISVFTGGAILLGYGILRGLRKAFPPGPFRMGAEDFLYWTCAGITVFLVAFWENDGIIRGFALMGTVLGMILYYKTLDRAVVGLTAWFVLAVTAPFRFFLKKIGNILRKMLKYFLKKGKMTLTFHKKRHNCSGQTESLADEAARK